MKEVNKSDNETLVDRHFLEVVAPLEPRESPKTSAMRNTARHDFWSAQLLCLCWLIGRRCRRPALDLSDVPLPPRQTYVERVVSKKSLIVHMLVRST